MPNPHLDHAIKLAGGQEALAGALGVTQQAISAWRRRGWLPVKYAPMVAQLTAVPAEHLGREALRPTRLPPVQRAGDIDRELRHAAPFQSSGPPPEIRMVTSTMPLSPRVTVRHFSLASGMSEATIRMKIALGKWVEGKQYHFDPDSQLWIDVKGVMAWIEGK